MRSRACARLRISTCRVGKGALFARRAHASRPRWAQRARRCSIVARADPRAFWKDSDVVGGIVEKYMQATFNRNEVGVAEAMRQAMAEVRGYYAGGK